MAAPGGAWRSKAAQARAAAAPPPAAPSPAPSKPAAKPAAKPAIEAGPSGQAVDERVLFVASVLIGYTVRVEVKSGEVWEGIFHALRPAGADFDVLLRWAKPVPAAGGRTPDSWDDAPAHGQAAADWQPVRPQPLFTIAAGELVQISASDVRMGAADVGAAGGWDDAGGFGTDAAISRARGAWGRERELQRWAPDEGDVAHMLHLEESVGHVERGWDQFAVNEAKFGVRTDYAEELYTTELDPSKSKISVAEAARIAAEIERGDHSSVANIHLLEERGVAIDDSQMDEEDRYGAVVREAPSAAGGGGAGATNGAAGGGAAPPRPNAWAAGRPRPLMPGAAPSAPIAIDIRRETNKLRAQMTSGVKAASPYGTPNAIKRASPLSSPLISDPSKLEALNLNPGVPRVDEQTRREFEQFKAQQAASKGGGPDMFKKQEVQEFKKFSENIESKLSRSLGKESGMAAAAQLAAGGGAAPAAAQEAAPAAAAGGEAAAAAGGAEQPAAPAAAAPAAGGEAPKKSSGLNPFAKSFSFNPSAKEFKPTFTPPAAAAGAAAAAPAAAAAAPAAAGAPAAADAAPAGGAPAAAPGAAPGAGAAGMPAGGPVGGPGPAGGFRQGPPSPMRGPMQPSGIPMPDMRPDFRRGPRGEGRDLSEGPHPRPERDGSFGRGRRDESRERGPGSYERRRDGRHFDGPGMRPGEGPPPPPPGKGPGPSMQMFPGMPMGPGMMVGPGMPMAPGMVPVMMGPGGQPMFMVRPMGPGQQGMAMPMQVFPGMPAGAPMMMFPPGARPMMGPPGMMPPGMMAPGMFPPGAGGPGGPGGKGGDRGDRGDD